MKKLAGAVNYRYLLSLLLSILFAFLIGAGILAVSGFHPLEAYGAMLSGAFDSARHIGDFLEYAMVLCVCGLACVLGARVGIFNVGGEGQLLLGAIFAAQVGVWMDGQPRFLVIVCAALAAMAVGGLYAFLPGVLKVKVKVNEVITTIMLNTIAAYLCQYLAKGPWKNANKNMVAATEQLGAQYWFGNVIPRSNLTSAVFAAAGMALPQLIFWAGAIVPSFWGSHSTMAVYRKYSTFSRVDRASASSTAQVRQPIWKAAAAKYSLGMKPAKMGIPTMDRAPTVNTHPAAGSRWAAPRRLLKS